MFGRTLSCLIFLPLLLLSNGSANPKAQAPDNESEKTPMQNAGLAQTGPEGFVPGPDVITGDMADLYVSGIESAELGLSIGITSCNRGNATPHFSPIPSTNHPVVAQNLYRMSGGASNDERFEQIGQSWVKHTYGASAADECGLGCTDPHNVYLLGVGCSDTYGTGQSAVQSDLGSRAWVNPFTGAFPATARDHTGHIHSNTSHMILTGTSDVDPAANPGATYYAEVQYIVPDEYAWCQAHPTECNMFNNPSYRRYDVTDTSFFIFSEVGATVQMSPALNAWTGASVHPFEGVLLGTDGRGFIAYKVTNPSAGVWHYEYAIYNMNLDRAIQFFRVPLGCGITVSNVGFHAPRNHPAFPHDGTFGDAGFSNAPWSSIQTASALTWSSQTFAQNQNANAIRWGTLYNFRFDADQPPQATGAMIGFFKTGGPVLVGVQGPTCNAPPPPTPTPFPPGTAQAVNLSTRMRVQTGDNVGIGGFIITGTASKHVLLRAVGPTIVLAGVTDALPDPVLELHGPGGFATITNDNWRDDPVQEAAIIATGLAPAIELEAAIDATLDPGTYTAIVRSTNNNSGTGLVEVYDLDQGVAAKLGNISTRAFVGTGADIMIAGFILGSHNDADRIVVRGIGPSLTATGVPNALADPTLELRDSHGALLASNDNWQDNATSAAELIAAGLAPTNNLESGIATTLPAGSYTALLSGVNNGTGVGLVEVYDRGAP